MAILEKKINPSLRLKIRDAYQQGKKDSDLVNQLLISEGKGGSPNTPTPDWDKDWPKPGTKPRPEDRPNIPTKLASLADGRPDPSIMNYVTEKGFFLDGRGNAYQQRGNKFGAPTEYNPDIHGLPVPLGKLLQINPQIANFLTPSGTGKTLSDEWYDKGLETIMETTQPGSGMREERLDILNHQYLDQVTNPLKINPQIAHAGPGQYYTEEGEVTDVSPYTFNRNTTQMEVPWLKEQYYQDLPRREKLHEDLKIRK